MSRIIKSSQVNIVDQKLLKPEVNVLIQNYTREINNDINENKEVLKEKEKIDEEIQDLLNRKDQIIKENTQLRELAKKENEKIIEHARLEYEKMIISAKQESQIIYNEEKERAYAQGYEAGYNQSMSEYHALISEALEIKNSVLTWKNEQVDNLEKNIIDLVLNSIEKIIKIKLNEDDNVVLNILKEGLDKFTFTESLIVRASNDDFDIINSSKDKILAMTDHIDQIEIKVDNSLKKGDIIIDTNSGSINPSVTNQLEILKEEFLNLLQSGDR